jgi:predicted amidohydrolase YtcJ
VWDLTSLGIIPRNLLDRAVPNRPVLINDGLGHAAFANSLAIRRAGIRSGSSDPQGGSFVRDRSGRLNGVVLENAQNIVSDVAEPPGRRTLRQNSMAVERALPQIAGEGITTISDAGGYWPRRRQAAWKQAERNGSLTTRASNAFWVYPNRPFERQVESITALRSGERDSLLRFNAVKIYVDGIVDYGTAALGRRYGSSPAWSPGGRRGFTYFSRRLLNRYVESFDRLGFMVHIHVWGDRATRLALDSIERARRINGSDGGPHRLTHVYLADRSDVKRFRDLDVTADMQLGKEAISPGYARSLMPIIGERDSSRLLPVADLLGSGANVNLSSDWDADELSPLKSMERSLSRRGSRQVVSDAATALRMVTINPARSLDLDSITGSIEVGKRADLTVLDADPLAVGRSSIGEIGVRLTLLGGSEVFSSPGFRR